MLKYLTLLGLLTSAAPAWCDPAQIIGTWASRTGPERLEFRADGVLRSCYDNGKQGTAAMGSWTEKQPGKFTIEFTHAASAACAQPPKLLRKYQVNISGQAEVSKLELALFVSGEFPPDRYTRQR